MLPRLYIVVAPDKYLLHPQLHLGCNAAEFLFFFFERSVIPLKGRRYPWCLPLKKIDGRNEIRHRRWRYFIVPGDRFRCEIPTRDIVPFVLSRCRSNCKLKTSSTSSSWKYSPLSRFQHSWNSLVRKQRFGFLQPTRVNLITRFATKRFLSSEFFKRSSRRNPPS